MRNHIRFTKEEKEEDIQLVLEALKEGQSYSKIAKDLGRSIQYIANIKKILIERGLITQEEIDFFSNANSTVATLKKPVLQKLQEGKTIEKIATELKTSASTIQDIADEMGVSYEFVWGRATELKDSGKLTPKQLQKSKKQKKDTKYSDVYGTILLMLNSGYTQQEIAKKIGKSMHFVIDRIQD